MDVPRPEHGRSQVRVRWRARRQVGERGGGGAQLDDRGWEEHEKNE